MNKIKTFALEMYDFWLYVNADMWDMFNLAGRILIYPFFALIVNLFFVILAGFGWMILLPFVTFDFIFTNLSSIFKKLFLK